MTPKWLPASVVVALALSSATGCELMNNGGTLAERGGNGGAGGDGGNGGLLGGNGGDGSGGTPTSGHGEHCDEAISVSFHCDQVHVASCCHELSNVVVMYEDGTWEKFDDLTGHCGNFGVAGGSEIVQVWVKAGSNASGDGPGWGEAFEGGESCGEETEPPPEDCECDDGGEPPSACTVTADDEHFFSVSLGETPYEFSVAAGEVVDPPGTPLTYESLDSAAVIAADGSGTTTGDASYETAFGYSVCCGDGTGEGSCDIGTYTFHS